jgi:hypothetical protein
MIILYYYLDDNKGSAAMVWREWNGLSVFSFSIFEKTFRTIFVIFVNFCKQIFAKSENRFHENVKTKFFVSTLVASVSSLKGWL